MFGNTELVIHSTECGHKSDKSRTKRSDILYRKRKQIPDIRASVRERSLSSHQYAIIWDG